MEVTYNNHQIEPLLFPPDRKYHTGSLRRDRRRSLRWGRQCESYKRRKREHNECSLDVDPGFEPDVMFPPLTPEEIILDEENRSVLYAALDQLPPIQAQRVYAHYILDKKKSEIAKAENVVESSVCNSIHRGLKNLSDILKIFIGREQQTALNPPDR